MAQSQIRQAQHYKGKRVIIVLAATGIAFLPLLSQGI